LKHFEDYTPRVVRKPQHLSIFKTLYRKNHKISITSAPYHDPRPVSGGKKFTTLHLSHGWRIVSVWYKKRFLYEVASAPAIFQKIMEIAGIPNVA
jgi:hypothetical protein